MPNSGPSTLGRSKLHTTVAGSRQLPDQGISTKASWELVRNALSAPPGPTESESLGMGPEFSVFNKPCSDLRTTGPSPRWGAVKHAAAANKTELERVQSSQAVSLTECSNSSCSSLEANPGPGTREAEAGGLRQRSNETPL